MHRCKKTRSLRALIVPLLAILGALLSFNASWAADPEAMTLAFCSLDTHQPHQLSGTLYLPEKQRAPSPAVVVIHGTGGIDSRGAFYRKAVLAEGIAFFEVDFQKGIYTEATDRPKNETFVPMAFAALQELRKLPSIDPARIGIMGFSLGGSVTVRTAFESYRKHWLGEEKGFIAHAAFYPVCGPILAKIGEIGRDGMTGAPLIIFYGTEDSYGAVLTVPELKRLLADRYHFSAETVEYAGAAHGFNRNAPAIHYQDPSSINGQGYMAWNEDAANDSRALLVAFLRRHLLTP